MTMDKAIELFNQKQYRDAFAAFAEIYNQCLDKYEREAVLFDVSRGVLYT